MLDPCSGKGSVKGIWTRESTLTHSLTQGTHKSEQNNRMLHESENRSD